MEYGNGGLSASDVALIQDRNNGFGGFGGDRCLVDHFIFNLRDGRLE